MKVSCAMYVEVTEESDLVSLDWDSLPKPIKVIGGGSNLLFTGDFPGTLLHVAIGGIGTGLDGTPVASLPPAPPTVLQTAGPSPYPRPGVDMSVEACAYPSEGVEVGAGVVFDDFCAWAAENGLWGPENLSHIPGDVGASAVQNIGAYGVEAKDIIAGIRAWDILERRFVDIDPADCEYGYRTSKFKTQWKDRFVITRVTFHLSRTPQPRLDYGGVRKALEQRGVRTSSSGDSGHFVPSGPSHSSANCGPLPLPTSGGGHAPEEEALTPLRIREVITDIRKQKLPEPEEMGSAGSFFCNPVISKEHFGRIVATAREDNGPEYQVPHYEVGDRIKVPAAWMIEQCGFKGATLGGAAVYHKQPLVIVNATGDASPEDIIGLEKRVIDGVAKKYGITLRPEVEHI